MKENAKKMKSLASDAVALSQLIGKAAYDICIDKNKQKQIISVNTEQMEKKAQGIIQKMTNLLEKIGEIIDTKLYGCLYKTPAEKLGHNDANDLIEKWMAGELGSNHKNAQKQFIMLTLISTDVGSKEGDSPSYRTGSSGSKQQTGKNPKAACCNIF